VHAGGFGTEHEEAGERVTIGDIIYWWGWAIAWVLTHLVCRYRVSGRQNVPRSGPLLIVANHLSWYDPLILGVVLPRRVWFFTKQEVFKWPVVGGLCLLTGQIPVRRGASDRASLEKALAYLHQGRAVMIFPEGTVERQEQMLPAHTGAAMLALRSGVTILPIAHTGTRRILRSIRSWFPQVCIEIGEPFTPQLPEGVARKVGLQIITQEIMERIAAMLPPDERGAYAAEGAAVNPSITSLPEKPKDRD
jgi:1-acyl-sn-glycerol-3-phosphate acyltransferase